VAPSTTGLAPFPPDPDGAECHAVAARRYRCTVLREQPSSAAMASTVQPSAWSRAAWMARSGAGGFGLSRPSARATLSRSSGPRPPYQPVRISGSSARRAIARQARRAVQLAHLSTSAGSGRSTAGWKVSGSSPRQAAELSWRSKDVRPEGWISARSSASRPAKKYGEFMTMCSSCEPEVSGNPMGQTRVSWGGPGAPARCLPGERTARCGSSGNGRCAGPKAYRGPRVHASGVHPRSPGVASSSHGGEVGVTLSLCRDPDHKSG